MNFTQMHERLRTELLRRIQRGSLSVSLLARQTGLTQAHLSNFLRCRRQLSLEAMDRVLAAQHLTATDLLIPARATPSVTYYAEQDSAPVVSHAVALFEPLIRPAAVQSMLHLPAGALQSLRPRSAQSRHAWQRFVVVRVPSPEALPMDPVAQPEALVLIDRHYTSLHPYRPNRQNIYAVRHGAHLRLRYVDFVANRVVLRPLSILFPVDLLETAPGEAPSDIVAGRVALIINEL